MNELPRDLNEAMAWFGALTPQQLDNLRLGGIVVLVLVVIVALLVSVMAWSRR